MRGAGTTPEGEVGEEAHKRISESRITPKTHEELLKHKKTGKKAFETREKS